MRQLSFLLALALAAASAVAQSPTPSFVPGNAADEAGIRSILTTEDDRYAAAQAPDMDWENAFGVRYTDTKRKNAFYHQSVDPLQAKSTETELEVRIRFISDDVALADVYNHRVGQIDQATNKPGADRWTRRTDILKKENGSWVIIAHRVADLRSPWYKHYDQLPAAFPVPAATLASYAGRYEISSDPRAEDVTVAGDHLLLKSDHGTKTLIPTSATDFLAFDPNDLADYSTVKFHTDPSGNLTISFAKPNVPTFATGTKAK